VKIDPTMDNRPDHRPLANATDRRRQVRSVFLAALIPCFFNQALCSARASVSAAAFGGPAGFPFDVDILITRAIYLAPPRMRWRAIPISGADVALDSAILRWDQTLNGRTACL
jgi:hypothetical protein